MDLPMRRVYPTLEPLWLEDKPFDGWAKSAFRASEPAHLPPPLQRSPRALPSTGVNRAAVPDPAAARYHQTRNRGLDEHDLRPLLFADDLPQSDHQAQTQQLTATDSRHPPQATTNDAPVPRRQSDLPLRHTIIDESRSLLLSGIPLSQLRDVGTSVTRRRSLPASTATSRRQSGVLHRDPLQIHATQVYHGNESLADCFVVATSLRRPSHASSGDDDLKADKKGAELARSDRVTVRVRIRPQSGERKPFVLQRTFDLTELRVTILEPSCPNASPISSRYHAAELVSPRWLHVTSPGSRSWRRASHGLLSSPGHGSSRLSRGLSDLADKAQPIHLPYARAHLPVLAALMLSGHVRGGDIIDLPLPHPEAWPQTVAYVYTGQKDLSQAVRENILYLAGKA